MSRRIEGALAEHLKPRDDLFLTSRMGMFAAKFGDKVVAVDTHMVVVPTPGGPVNTPLPHPFNGNIDGGLSQDVFIEGKPTATVGSTASNIPPHFPTPPGTSFVMPPSNKATISMGSQTVLINGKPAARMGDPATACSDPPIPNNGTVISAGTVMIG